MTDDLVDVLWYATDNRYVAVPAGDADRVVAAHEREAGKREAMRALLKWAVIAAVLGYALLVADDVLLGGLAAVAVSVGFAAGERFGDDVVPDVVARDVARADAVAQWDADVSSSLTPE